MSTTIDYVFYIALIVSIYAVFSVCLFPILSVHVLRELQCNVVCRIDTYLLILSTIALIITATFYWYSTRNIRKTSHKWGGTVSLFFLSTLLLFTQVFFVAGVFNDELDAQVYIKTGTGGVSLLTLLTVILSFVVGNQHRECTDNNNCNQLEPL